MKKVILVLCLLFSFIFIGCNSSEDNQKQFSEYNIKYKEAMQNYNETHNNKYLNEATSYLKEMERITNTRY